MNIIHLISYQCGGLKRLLHPLCTVLFCLMATGLLSSCEEEYEDYAPQKAGVQTLSASTTDLVLRQSNANQTAITFNWTSGTNHGTDAAIDYTVQFDKKGNNFSSPVEVAMGRAVYTNAYRVADLNNLLVNELGLATGEPHEVEVRVMSVEASGAVEPDYSNVVTVTATPYEPVTSTLYMIGDATPNGWDASNAVAMQVSPTNPTVFSTTVQLVPGNFKFITTQGQFLPSYNKGATDNALVYRTSYDQPDEQFTVTEGGLYKVTTNLSDLSLTMEKQAGPPYSQLWVVGSATPNGWDLDNADELEQSEADPFVFTYTAFLSEGELKIATQKDWGAPFYRPTTGNAPITSTDVQLSAGDPDNKWVVAEAGMYKITLNLRTMSITFDPINLYLIGDAGPNGWNIETPSPMTKNGSVYTYTGPLTAGELKVSKFKGGWCGGEWINAATADQAITNGSYITTYGCDGPDNKWRVTAATAGNYSISIDLATETMTIVKQ